MFLVILVVWVVEKQYQSGRKQKSILQKSSDVPVVTVEMLEEASLLPGLFFVALGVGMKLGNLYTFPKHLVAPSYPPWLLRSHTWGCGRTMNTRSQVFPEEHVTFIFTQVIPEACPDFCQDKCLPTSLPRILAEQVPPLRALPGASSPSWLTFSELFSSEVSLDGTLEMLSWAVVWRPEINIYIYFMVI